MNVMSFKFYKDLLKVVAFKVLKCMVVYTKDSYGLSRSCQMYLYKMVYI